MAAGIHYRPGRIEDSRAVFGVFERAIIDLGQRTGVMTISGGDNPAVLQKLWPNRRSLFEHLARTAHQFWVAERGNEVLGYARSILRDGLEELTEFFVIPEEQSEGIGQGLLERVFPKVEDRQRTIIATLDDRALIRYLRLGLIGLFPIKYFSRPAQKVAIPSDLVFEALELTPTVVESLERIDRQVIGHARPEDHHWLVSDRRGFLYRRDSHIVGYGYIGPSSGPFALLSTQDYPAVLAHAEGIAWEDGRRFGIEVPLTNRRALDYLLEQKYRMDGFTAIFMGQKLLGRFENYVFFSPPIMM